MTSKPLLEFSCEMVYVLKFYKRADGAVVLRGNGDNTGELVVENPAADRLEYIFEVDTAAMTGRIYRADAFPSHRPAAPAPPPARRRRQAEGAGERSPDGDDDTEDGVGIRGFLGEIDAIVTVEHPPTTRR